MSATTELTAATLQVLRELKPETMTGEAAVAAVRDFATIEKAAAAGRLFAAVRVAKTEAWRQQGHASPADWLAAQAGITVREAAAQLGTAAKAERLPKTKEQMRKGKLSAAQAGAVTQGASANPSEEDDLLNSAAKDTTATLKDKAAKVRAAAEDGEARDRRVRRERSMRKRIDADGAFNLWLRGPAIDGVRLDAMMRPFEEQAFRMGRSDGVRDSFENRSYDAFFAMLRHAFARSAGDASSRPDSTGPRREHIDPAPATAPPGATGANGANGPCRENIDPAPATAPPGATGGTGAGESSPSAVEPGRGTDPSKMHPAHPREASRAETIPGPGLTRPGGTGKPPGGNNIKVIVHISHTALQRGHTVGGETCEVEGLGPISVATAKELMADAFLAAVITKGKDVVNVAHLGRGLNAHQRTAIEAMGLRCSNRACNRTVALQIDHRRPYAEDKVTKLDNQDPLCPNCHRLKTHHGWHLEAGTGPRRFLPPDGPQPGRDAAAPVRGAAETDRDAAEPGRRAASPDCDTAAPGSAPGALDRSATIEPGPVADRAARALRAARNGRSASSTGPDQPALL